MKRRDFCKLMAATAAATAVPTAEAAQPGRRRPEPTVSPEEAAKVAATPEFKSFDTLSEDYAALCARPESEREFFELKDGGFVKEKLDEATWTPSRAAHASMLAR